MVPKDPAKYKGRMTNIGGGQQGIVVGALSKNLGLFKAPELRYHRNNPKDIAAVQELLKSREPGSGHYETSINRVVRDKVDYTDDEIDEILQKARAYRTSSRKDPVEYPGLLSNMMDRGINSNSFVASLLDYSGHGKKEKKMDVPGYDAGSSLRLPKNMFKGKTAADILNKEALSVDDVVSKIRNTDPRLWSTPMGAAASLALTHALGDPSRRSRLRYLTAGLGGAAAGYGTGEILKANMPFFNPNIEENLGKVLDTPAAGSDEVPGIPQDAPPTSLLDLTSDTDFDTGKRNIREYIRGNLQGLTEDVDVDNWNTIDKWLRERDPKKYADKPASWWDLTREKGRTLLTHPGTGSRKEMDDIMGVIDRTRQKGRIAQNMLRKYPGRISDEQKSTLFPLLRKAVQYGSPAGFDMKESPMYDKQREYRRRAAKSWGAALPFGVSGLPGVTSGLWDGTKKLMGAFTPRGK